MKGVHAVLGYASSMAYNTQNAVTITSNIANYFVAKWQGSPLIQNTTGLFPAWRDAIFQATYYDNGYGTGNAPAVIFTAGDILGQNNIASHYWGWEEKPWNIYNGATYLTDMDKNAYGGNGETLVYNSNYGYPNKIGAKYATIGSPHWEDIVILP
jgi:hypothetical protein